MDVAGLIYMPLSDNSQNPLSNAPLGLPLPPNRHPDEYSNSDINYLNDKLNSDAIKALQPFSNKPSLTRG